MLLSDIDLIEQYYINKARENFLVFRQLINPKLILGEWVIDSTKHLQQYYNDLISGKRPKLIIQAPPQHGKSELITDFILWLLGKQPDTKTIYASFSERLGIRANLKVQRTLDKEIYRKIFPDTSINKKNITTVSSQSVRNRELIEVIGHDGYFRNTTIGGSITGESLDLGIIDDPIKGRAEANSITTRNRAWDWFTDDFSTRFSENAGLLIILTRWHIDDPIGRLIEKDKSVKVLTYRAIKENGTALFPEHKSLEFLLDIKNNMTPANFEALYQQNPIIQDGELMKSNWFKWWESLPKIQETSIFVDTAQKKGELNDWTVAQYWGHDGSGQIFLLDMLRIKENAPEAQKMIEAFYFKYALDVENRFKKMYIEDKSSGQTMLQVFKNKGMLVEGIQRNIDKVQRVNMFAGYIEMGKVWINPKIKGIDYLIDEAISFPNGVHDDTIDPMMDAIEKYCIERKKLGFMDLPKNATMQTKRRYNVRHF